jgi:hypothetical protein
VCNDTSGEPNILSVDYLVEYVIQAIPRVNALKINYKVSEGMDAPNGKYPNTLGNVAIVDCHGI